MIARSLAGLSSVALVGLALVPRLASGGALKATVAEDKSHVDIHDGDKLVLRYHYGNAPLPEGVPARYTCGDYIQPLCGPDGEALTEAHPKDHAHHRGVMWTWPVVKWKGQPRDPWAVAGCWHRPEKLADPAAGPDSARINATQLWKWDDKEPVVREEVTIQATPWTERGRFVDIAIGLTSLVDELTISGRPYGGFGLRMAPRKDQKITLLTDPADAKPRRSWIEYSDTFEGGKGRVGVAILEHPSNPQYPNVLLQYPDLNYVMPGFPGQKDYPLPKGQTLTLRHRLWIHPGHADEKALAEQWAAYAKPPEGKAE
jgi:hypothetical protein